MSELKCSTCEEVFELLSKCDKCDSKNCVDDSYVCNVCTALFCVDHDQSCFRCKITACDDHPIKCMSRSV